MRAWQLLLVANLTRQDDPDFLRPAPKIGFVTHTTRYPLQRANQALADLRAGRFKGAAVLVPRVTSHSGIHDRAGAAPKYARTFATI
jgi:D-arabinose 1-dehydrogenase-like Zn-dependent alcohol dehydrogenase